MPVHVREMGAGANAIDAAYRVIGGAARARSRVERRQGGPRRISRPRTHPINLNIGKIEGGDWASSVPAWCRIDCRIAIYPGHVRGRGRGARDRAAVARLSPATTRSWPTTRRGSPSTASSPRATCSSRARRPRPCSAGPMRAATGTPLESFMTAGYLDTRVYALYDRCRRSATARSAQNIHGFDERVSLASVRRITTRDGAVHRRMVRDGSRVRGMNQDRRRDPTGGLGTRRAGTRPSEPSPRRRVGGRRGRIARERGRRRCPPSTFGPGCHRAGNGASRVTVYGARCRAEVVTRLRTPPSNPAVEAHRCEDRAGGFGRRAPGGPRDPRIAPPHAARSIASPRTRAISPIWPCSRISGGESAMMSPVTRTSRPRVEAIHEHVVAALARRAGARCRARCRRSGRWLRMSMTCGRARAGRASPRPIVGEFGGPGRAGPRRA